MTRYVDGLGLEQAHLVRVTSGGWLAANLALHDPRRIASLTLVEPAQVFGRFPGSRARLPRRATRRPESPAGPGAPPDRRRASLEDPGGRVTAAVAAGFPSAVPPPRRPTDAQLRSLRVPTLVVIGGCSRTLRPRQAYDRARSLLPTWRQKWPEGSHALSGQCAEQLNTRVLEFIADVEHRDPSTRRAAPLARHGGDCSPTAPESAWTGRPDRPGPCWCREGAVARSVDMVGEVRLPGSTHARLGTTTSDPGWRGSPRLPT